MKTIKRLINYIKYKRSANRIIKEVKRQILVDVKNEPKSVEGQENKLFESNFETYIISDSYSLPKGYIALSFFKQESNSSEVKTIIDGSLRFGISISTKKEKIKNIGKILKAEFNSIIKKVMEIDRLNSMFPESNAKKRSEKFMKKIKSENQTTREFLELLFITFKTEKNNRLKILEKQIKSMKTKNHRDSLQQVTNLKTIDDVRRMIQLQPIKIEQLRGLDKSLFISEFNKEFWELSCKTNEIKKFSTIIDIESFFDHWVKVINSVGINEFYMHIISIVGEKHSMSEHEVLVSNSISFQNQMFGNWFD